ncbi:unnamed protein product [Clonostachys rosea f. rosea IK726]|uniref:Uncharacterized protein n=1 Tax=Clonostachys rosea f. rosea IK726 TaxID=1349383 RepID=A0ACA9U9C2_BIOOC|nr:unnamed protein product [Clonostachys rosea f. rosea IK726]
MIHSACSTPRKTLFKPLSYFFHSFQIPSLCTVLLFLYPAIRVTTTKVNKPNVILVINKHILWFGIPPYAASFMDTAKDVVQVVNPTAKMLTTLFLIGNILEGTKYPPSFGFDVAKQHANDTLIEPART